MRHLATITALSLTLCSATAQRGDKGNEQQVDPFPLDKTPPAPVLSPEESMATFVVEPGFKVELVAAEPMIEDPVAIRFDERGRMWVVELRGYMPDIDGNNEDAPVGRIVILEDTDGDGTMDSSKVFLDGLNQVRAIALVENGVLYCPPPELWFVERDSNDQPGAKTLIDAKYATGGNVEHKPNGLMPALDNWLYSAKSNRRYRKIDGAWTMDTTESRGQWGIAQDNFGRLYYNTNSSGLRADSAPPSLLMRNPNFKSKNGINAGLGSNRIVSIRPNPGINRGYRPGMLDDKGHLRSFTSACGPCVYRGDAFPADYQGDGFVPEPVANLIKRYKITDDDARVTGSDATPDRSFLASTDERFRPVSIQNAPDGNLYVVDFYRGIIQHKTYVTSYLRRQILHRGLDKPIGLGRIYRIVPDKAQPAPRPKLAGLDNESLVAQLASTNGWTRDTAQRLLVQMGDDAPVDALQKLAAEPSQALGQVHALWTLEGLGSLDEAVLGKIAATATEGKVLATVARFSSSLDTLASLAKSPSADVQLALAFRLGELPNTGALELLTDVVLNQTKHSLVADAAISGLAGRELDFLAVLDARDEVPDKLLAQLTETAERAAEGSAPETLLTGNALKSFERGKVAYSTTCFACHGADGAGITPLAPPLVNSEWVTGTPSRLAHIILNGLQGPIKVDGKTYAPPEIQPIMPGLGLTPDFDDKKIADIMTYVRNAWGNQASPTAPAEVAAARASAKQGIYTPEELGD